MDLDMMAHPSTVANIEKLRSYGNIIIEPAAGELASHLVGKGRMEEPENIVAVLDRYFASQGDMAGRNVMVTAGPTYERIDPVRFIGNFSTGKMGYAIANEAARRGANVTLVSGPVANLAVEKGVNVVKVESAREMLAAAEAAFAESDVAVLTAAVADYRPAECLDRKIKREHSDISAIEIVKNPDIAATLGAKKRPGQRLVGFALETDNEVAHATEKLTRKNLDMIVLNSLRDSGAGFGTDTNKVSLVYADGRAQRDFELKAKTAVAKDIIDAIKEL
jgi:phosphopantothenoylcysteine decarboxylase/phosphopantothenate--cysteine ligase